MPSAAVVAPIALPLIATAVIVVFGLAGIDLGRTVTSTGAWATGASLLVVWLPVRSSVELYLGQLGYGSALDLRVDAVAVAFGLIIVAPAAVLLTLQPRPWPEAALSLVGVAAAVAAVEAGGVVLTAIAGGTAATVAVMLLDTEDPNAPRPSWAVLLGGWVLLSLVGVALQVGGGTAVFSAVPVAAVTAPVFTLLVASALLASSVFPWRSWPSRLWMRPNLRAAGIVVATLFPLGFYLFVRAYEMGDGRYPSPAFNIVLTLIGLGTALAAAARAQAVATRREFLGEVIPGFGGFALAAVALGTPLGLVTGIVLLATAAALVACLALLPDRAGLASLVTIAAAVGLPPSVTFGARVVGIAATFEAGDFLGLIGIGIAVAWAVWMVAGARAIGLPGGRGHPASETFPLVAMIIATLVLVGGPALAVLQSGLANPVAAEVMASAPVAVGGGLTSVVTTSSLLPVVTLFAPLLLIAVAVYLLTNPAAIRTQARPAPFRIPRPTFLATARAALREATVPEQYRSLLNLRELEAAAAGGQPVLWLVAIAALGFAVTRF